jgi:hypothetical protein
LTVTNEAKRNEDTVEPLVRHFLDSQLVSGICWDFPEQSGWPDVKRVLEQGFRAGVAAERERGARLLGEARAALYRIGVEVDVVMSNDKAQILSGRE